MTYITSSELLRRSRARGEEALRRIENEALAALLPLIADWASEQWIEEHRTALREVAITVATSATRANLRDDVQYLVLMIEARHDFELEMRRHAASKLN